MCVSCGISVRLLAFVYASVHAGIAREEMDLKVEEETVVPGLGYSVDIMLPEIGVCVEFEGPTHFISDLASGVDTRFNGTFLSVFGALSPPPHSREREERERDERERESERAREREREREEDRFTINR